MGQNKISEAFAVIKKNIDQMAKENDALFVLDDFSEWTVKVKRRSENIRKMYSENEKAIAFLMDTLESEIDHDTVESFFWGIYSLKEDELHDAGFMIKIMKRLVPFYEAENNYDRLVFLYINIAYEEMEYYLRMDPEEYKEEVRDYLLKVISLRDHYQEIKEVENRQRIFMAYYNLIASLSDLVVEYRRDTLDYYEEAIEFLTAIWYRISMEHVRIFRTKYCISMISLL